MKKRLRPKPPFHIDQRVKLIENPKRKGTVKRVRGAANYHYWYVDVQMDDGEFIPSIDGCWIPA